MQSLTKVEKAKARVCYAALLTALVMQRVNEQVGITGEQPAIQQCTALIDDLINPMPEARRAIVLARIQRARIKFYKKAEKADAASALIAVIETVTGPTFKSKVGTRFDFIRAVLRQNLQLVKDTIPYSQSTVDAFAADFKQSIFDI